MYFPCLADFSRSRADRLGKHVFKKATPVSNKLSSWWRQKRLGSMCLALQLGQFEKSRPKLDLKKIVKLTDDTFTYAYNRKIPPKLKFQKNREIDWWYLSLQQFDKFWMWSSYSRVKGWKLLWKIREIAINKLNWMFFSGEFLALKFSKSSALAQVTPCHGGLVAHDSLMNICTS